MVKMVVEVVVVVMMMMMMMEVDMLIPKVGTSWRALGLARMDATAAAAGALLHVTSVSMMTEPERMDVIRTRC